MTFGNPRDKDAALKWVVERTENVRLSAPIKEKFFIGASKWAQKDWIGGIYRKGTKDKDFFKEYLKHFNSIELNATHYRIDKEQLIKWRKAAEGKQFLFFPKMIQGISHFGFGNSYNTPSVNQAAEDFFDGIRLLQPNLGAVFMQMSDKFGIDRKDRLIEWLNRYKHKTEMHLALRDPSWFEDGGELIAEALRDLKVGFVIEDTAVGRDMVHMQLTIPRVFIRFMAYDHTTDITRLSNWANKLKEWFNQGLERAYFFVHCSNEAKVPELIFQMGHSMFG